MFPRRVGSRLRPDSASHLGSREHRCFPHGNVLAPQNTYTLGPASCSLHTSAVLFSSLVQFSQAKHTNDSQVGLCSVRTMFFERPKACNICLCSVCEPPEHACAVFSNACMRPAHNCALLHGAFSCSLEQNTEVQKSSLKVHVEPSRLARIIVIQTVDVYPAACINPVYYRRRT